MNKQNKREPGEPHQYNDEYSELKNIAIALFGIAKELRGLGFNNASNPHRGGMEAIAHEIKEGLSGLSEILDKENNE